MAVTEPPAELAVPAHFLIVPVRQVGEAVAVVATAVPGELVRLV